MSHAILDIYVFSKSVIVYLKSIYMYHIDIVQRSPIFLFAKPGIPREEQIDAQQ